MMFETRRRRQELNQKINLKSVHFVILHYIIVSQCMVQKTYYRCLIPPENILWFSVDHYGEMTTGGCAFAGELNFKN